ncbi:MAG: TonB-dependent receptor [Persephonella sp.]|nr:MAG: TonB-dependent receptor [Persephonella sp.]
MRRIFYFILAIPFVSYGEEQVFRLGDLNIKRIDKNTKVNINQEELSISEIVADRNIDLGDILSSKFPNIYKVRKSGINNDIYLRGFGRDNINVLLDGSRIYNACPNRMDSPISHIDLSEVEKVEISEGAFDVENEGSLGGIINVITKEPSEDNYFRLSAILGSYSYQSFNSLFNVGDNLVHVLVGLSLQDSKVFKSGEGKYLTEYSGSPYKQGKINGNFFLKKSGFAKLNFNLFEENQLKLYVGYEYLQDVLYPYLLMDTSSEMTYKTRLELINKPSDLKIAVYFNSVKHDMSDKFRLSSDRAMAGYNYSMRTVAKSRVKGFKVSKSFSIQDTRLKVGLEGFERYWLADNIITMGTLIDNRGMIPAVKIKNLGLFIDGKKKIKNMIVGAGLRYDILKSKADENSFGVSNRNLYQRYYQFFSYKNNDYLISGNITFKYKFNKKNNVYVGYGHTIRVPDPEERYIALNKPMTKPDWVGNPNLKPVKNDEIDLGFEYYKGLFSIKGKAFYSKLTDYIYLTRISSLDNTSTATSYKNIDAHIYGISLSLISYITNNLYTEFSLAYQRGRKDSEGYNDKDLAEIPPLKVRFALNYENEKFRGELENIYSSSQKNVDTDLNEYKTSAYYIANIKGRYSINKNLNVGFGIDNFFNITYYSHLSYLRNPFSSGTKIPEPGRFTYLNVNLNF